MIERLTDADTIPRWVETVALNIVAGIVTLAIAAALGLLLFKWNYKSEIAGTYKALVIDEAGQQVPWGEVRIRYNLLTDDLRTFLTHGDREVNGRARLVALRYLVGHYLEKGRPTRRRFGAFLYPLDGHGDALSGKYLYFDPNSTTLG